MKKVIVLIGLLIGSLGTAQSDFETGMQQAFKLWGENKALEASAMFERIAEAEPQNWLPTYYVALVNTTEAFKTQDKVKIENLLAKAQNAQETLNTLQPDNAETYVMQALIQTAWIVYDPMTNGQRLSGKVMDLYGKAEALDPKNPRVWLCQAEFEMGAAKFFKQDISPMCADVQKAADLFATFVPETPFHPTWGADRATEILKTCPKK